MRAARMRWSRLDLRWKLAGWVALVMLVCTGVTFLVVYHGTGTQVRRQIDGEIADDAEELSHTLVLAGRSGSPVHVFAAANQYVREQSFAAGSTLLFAVVPGEGTSTNRPEALATDQPDRGEPSIVRQRENRLSNQLLSAPVGFSTLALDDIGEERLLKLTAMLRGGLRVTVGVAEPLAPVSHAQAGVARAFILAAVLTLAGALLAAYVIGTRVSRPLRRMAAVAARVDAGDLHPRIDDSGSQGREVRVLAEAFNNMLDRLTTAFAGQRAFVADASHELRTPLTVIRGELEVLAAQRDPPPVEVRRVEALVQAEIARITRLVDDLLLLARSEQARFLHIEPVDLRSFVDALWNATKLLADRRFELGPVPSGALRADPDRLAQALRNLLSNAIEHTAEGRGLVRMQIDPRAGDRIAFVVDDDGPGVAPEQRELIFERFYRTDDARDRASGGIGLGLAIVRAIALAHEGRVSASRSPQGGARVELELPGYSGEPPGPVRQEPALTEDAGVPDRVAAGLRPHA